MDAEGKGVACPRSFHLLFWVCLHPSPPWSLPQDSGLIKLYKRLPKKLASRWVQLARAPAGEGGREESKSGCSFSGSSMEVTSVWSVLPKTVTVPLKVACSSHCVLFWVSVTCPFPLPRVATALPLLALVPVLCHGFPIPAIPL